MFLFACKHEFNWNPFKNLEQAEECKERLREVGKYDVIGFEVENELEAICNACINFLEREEDNSGGKE